MSFQARQGDVLILQVGNRTPVGEAVNDEGRVILASGEVTGHAHEVLATDPDIDEPPPAQLFEEPDGPRNLFVERACVLTHQEHGPIPLAPGCYRVIRQREYAPEEIRPVAD